MILKSQNMLNEDMAKLQIRKYKSRRYVVVLELWERTEYFLEYFDSLVGAEKLFNKTLPLKLVSFRKKEADD